MLDPPSPSYVYDIVNICQSEELISLSVPSLHHLEAPMVLRGCEIKQSHAPLIKRGAWTWCNLPFMGNFNPYSTI